MYEIQKDQSVPVKFFAGEYPVVTAVKAVATGKSVKQYEPVKLTDSGIEPVVKVAASEAVSGTSTPAKSEYENTTAGIYGIAATAAEAAEEVVVYLTGEFFADAITLPEGVTADTLAKAFRNISLVNGAISGLNKLKIPDWVPGIGGKGINIPLIPQFATGTDSTPDTFIAGEQGAELITNAKNRSVFTAAQTGSIFRNLADTVNAIRTAGAAPYQLAYAGAPSVAAPTLNAGDGRTSVVIHSAPVFHVGNDAQAQDIEEMLRRHDEELLDEIDERERQRQDDERRRNYD